jgi:phospholipid transport system substrate-binding protein
MFVGFRYHLAAGFVASLLLSALAGVFAPDGATAQSGRSASAFLEGRHDEVNRVLQQAAADDAARQRRTERLNRLLTDLLDYEELSRRSLGDHWNQRNDAERRQFVELLRRLVERNYEGNLERTLDYEVSYDRESQRGDLTVVHTTARSRAQRRQPPVAIDYAMRAAGGTWRVVDVSTDGVSMVENYRSQFGRIISRDGWGELITRMQRRLAQGGSET